MVFPTSPADLRFPGALVSFEKVGFGYASGKPLLRDINQTIHPEERIDLAGLNGSGKSTLVASAMGNSTTRAGDIIRHACARFGLYSQQAVEGPSLQHTFRLSLHQLTPHGLCWVMCVREIRRYFGVVVCVACQRAQSKDAPVFTRLKVESHDLLVVGRLRLTTSIDPRSLEVNF